MAGNAIGGVVIDASRHVNRIIDIDTDARIAVVQPGWCSPICWLPRDRWG